jgi:hypothetical protein
VNARLSATEARGKNAKTPVRFIFAGVIKCQYCGGTVTRVNKGDHVYLVCSAAHGNMSLRASESRFNIRAIRLRSSITAMAPLV